MDTGRQQRIVVGVSGSPASQAALNWAAGEARLRGAALHVVHVWDPVPHRAPYALLTGPTGEQQRQTADGQLANVLRRAFGPATPQWVTAELAEGVAERVLVRRSAGSSLLVIGATTPAETLGPPAGSVVRACLTHAKCPLVIIGMAASPSRITGLGNSPSRVACARLMRDRHIKRMPVVDDEGHLAGIVSRVDLLSVYERPDGRIRDEIITGVIAGRFQLDPHGFEVAVTSGIVTIAGAMEAYASALYLLGAIRSVEGVVAVRDRLSYPPD